MTFPRVRRFVLALAAAIAMAGPALAQDRTDPNAPEPPRPGLDISARAALCAACHGADGKPVAAGAPVLWGQQEGYLYLQLRDLKNGVRQSAAMNAIASTLSREDMHELAAYFAAKPWPSLQQPSTDAATERAARTINSSIGCTGCHLANYQGDSAVPRLSGQRKDYLLSTMLAFRDRSRANNPGMSDLMNAASEADLKAMADFLSGL